MSAESKNLNDLRKLSDVALVEQLDVVEKEIPVKVEEAKIASATLATKYFDLQISRGQKANITAIQKEKAKDLEMRLKFGLVALPIEKAEVGDISPALEIKPVE
jgi:preprotein translocase subunit SecD